MSSRWPIVMLLLLPSLLTELLSSSMQPGIFLFLSPFVVTMYGAGALLVRELTVRWGKGWPTVFVLGFAYGLCEEGALQTCFDPKNSDGYGRWLGVNWIWTQNMNLWHAVFSIAIPILLTHLAFPVRQREPWISRRGSAILAVLFAADVVFINRALVQYRPNPIVYPALLLVIGGLIVAARHLPRTLSGPGPQGQAGRPVSPIVFFAIGLFATPLYYIVPSDVQKLGAPPAITLLATLAYVVTVSWLILRLARRGTWSPLHQFSLAAGAYGLYIVGSPVAPAWVFLATWHADHISPQVVFGVVAVLYLYWLWRRIRRSQADIPVSSREL